jgi:hypothetical protein
MGESGHRSVEFDLGVKSMTPTNPPPSTVVPAVMGKVEHACREVAFYVHP